MAIINGTNANDTLNGTASADTIIGFDGNDAIFGLDAADFIVGDNPDGTGNGNDSVIAGSGDDVVLAGAGNDTVFGNDGNDLIGVDQGNDSVDAGTGNDTIFAGPGDDVIVTGDGNDLVSGDFGNDIITGNAGVDVLYGGFGNDLITGDDGDDVILGDQGTDTLDGGAGNDVFLIDFDDNQVVGGAGTDVIIFDPAYGTPIDLNLGAAGNQNNGLGPVIQSIEYVNAGLVTVPVSITGRDDVAVIEVGGLNNDFLAGGEMNDLLVGGTGNDTLRGGDGDDALAGNAGNDVFQFSTTETGTSLVLDFVIGADKIQILGGSGIDVASAVATQLDLGDFRLLVIGTKAVLVNDTGALTADDFIVGGPDVVIIPSATGTAGPDTLPLAVDTNGGTQVLSGELDADGTIIDGLGGTDILRITGDAMMRIDVTNPNSQLEQLDLDGSGGFNGPAETNVANSGSNPNPVIVRNFEIFDAYPRQVLLDPANPSDDQRANNYFGSLLYDGTGFGGDGINTDGNIVLGGFGSDSILTGIGNDFIAGGAGADTLNGGRNADFFFIEGALLEPFVDVGPSVNGGTTFDSNPDQDTDWVLPEFSDDDEPVLIDLRPLPLLTFQGILTDAGVVVRFSDIENVDASGNLYGFMDGIATPLGGARDYAITGQGIGSTAQLRINGSEEANILIAGYDNDEVIGRESGDIIFGGNLLFNVNPNITGLGFDGRDSLFGSDGNDTIGYESFDVSVGGGEDTVGGNPNDTVGGADTLLIFDPDRANGITTQSQLIADRDEVSPGLPDAQRSIFGTVDNLAYDRDDNLDGGARLFNIDNPSPLSDDTDYLFIDLDAPTYAFLITGNTSQDQTGGVSMTGFEDVNGSGRNARALARFGDSMALADIGYLVGPIDPDGSNVGVANALSFEATGVNLDLRGTDPLVDVQSFNVPANGNNGTTHQVRIEDFGDNVLIGGEGTDRIEGRGGDDTLAGGLNVDDDNPTPDLFVFDIRGQVDRDVVSDFQPEVVCDTFGVTYIDHDKVLDPLPFTDETDPVSYDGNDTLTGDSQPDLRRGDGQDVIIDFEVGDGATPTSQRVDIDQVVFYEFNNGVQGYLEDRAAALTDDVQLDAAAIGGSLDQDATEAADTAVDLNASGDGSAGIRAVQEFSADLDDIQRFDVATLTVEGLSFKNGTLAAGQNQRQAAAQIINRVNFLAGMNSSLASMTASPALVDYLGIGLFDDDADGLADSVDGNDINGASVRIELNNFDKNVFYDTALTINNLSAGDQQADFFRLNNDTWSQILFEGFQGSDGGFNDQNILFLLRTATGVNGGDRVSDAIQVQSSIIESARDAGSTVAGLSTTNYGDDQLFGGIGSDVINAGGGDDIIHGSLGSDAIDGGSGIDRLLYERGIVGDLTVTISAFATGSGLGMIALTGTVAKTLGGTDSITGVEIVDKIGDVADGPTVGINYSLISTDVLNIAPLSDTLNNDLDTGKLLFDMTNGNFFVITDTTPPILQGQAIITGMDNVTGGDLDEEVMMGVKGIDTDEDNDVSPEFVLIDGSAATAVLVDAVVAPEAFRPNLIDLDNRDDDGAGAGQTADGDPDDADRVIYCFDSLYTDYDMNAIRDNRPDLEVFVSATGEPSTTPGGILIPVDETTDIVRMYEGFLDANPFNVSQVDDTLKNVEILNVEDLDTNNAGAASTGSINTTQFGSFTRYDIINVVTLSSVPNSDIPAILPTQYDGVVVNYADDQAIGGDLGQVDIDGDTLLDGDGVLEAGAIALGFEPDEQQLIIQGIDEMEVVLAGSGNDRVISSPFFARADSNQGGAEGTYHWILQGGQDDMVDHRNFVWVGPDSSPGVEVLVDFTNSTNLMFTDSEGNPVIEGFVDRISLSGTDNLAGPLSRTDYAYNVEDYVGAYFTASDDDSSDGTTVLYNPNAIDISSFTGSNADAIGANSTADDVYVVFSDPGAGRFDPNNNQTSLVGNSVRTVSQNGSVFGVFLDLDDTSNIDGSGLSGIQSNYWAVVDGGAADDFVLLDDEQTPQYHQLNLGTGSNLVSYGRVGDNIGAPGAINTYFFQTNAGNETSSDLYTLINGQVTDEINVTENDDQSAAVTDGGGLQRELTLHGSDDPDVKDVLDLSPDSTIPGTGGNAFSNGVFTPGTHFVSLDVLTGTVYATSAPGASGIVLQGVLDIEASGRDDQTGTVVADFDDLYSVSSGTAIGGSNLVALPATVFTPTLYSSTGARSIHDDIGIASIVEQSARETTGRSTSSLSNTTGTQLGNAQLGLQQIEVVNGNALGADVSLVLFGLIDSRDTLFGGDGDDRIYATGDSTDVLDAFRGIETMTGGVVTDFVGTFGSTTTTATATDGSTVGSTDFDTLAFIDNASFDTLVDSTATPYVIALNALGNSSTAGNEFISGPTVIGSVYDFENLDAREVGVNTFRDQYAANFGAPDGTSLSFFQVVANQNGSIIFGANTFDTSATGTTNGDGGDSLYGGAGNDTIGGAFGGDLIVLDAIDTDGTGSNTATSTSANAGNDVVVYQFTTDSTSNGIGITSHHVDVVQGFTVVGTITVDTTTTPATITNTAIDAEEDVFDFRDVDANTQTTGVDDAFNFFNTFEVAGGAAAGIAGGFAAAGAIAANQNGVATLVFAPDATAAATSGTLYAYVDGDNNPDMTIKVTGTALEIMDSINFLL